MADERHDLTTESSELLDRLEEIRHLEREKRREPASSPGFQMLADRVDARSRALFRLGVGAAEDDDGGSGEPTRDADQRDDAGEP